MPPVRARAAKCAATLAVLLLAAGACKSVQYGADYSPRADFGSYSTWAWNPKGNNLSDDPRFNMEMIEKRIVAAVEATLPDRGLTRASVEDADLLVVFHLSINGKLSASTINSFYAYPYYWGYPGPYAWGSPNGGMASWDEGTLLIDLVENTAGDDDQLVWRGTAEGGIEKESREPEETERRTRDLVRRILGKYPPG